MDKSHPKSEQNLVDWVAPYPTTTRRVRMIIDPRLEGQFSVKGSRAVATLASQCVNPKPKARPSMHVVVDVLEGLEHLRDMAGSLPPAQLTRAYRTPRVSR
ncbi:hypothetical protein AMTR_s00128p00104140 [Amborella trichopoda]|uniref:Protein kinase domain-containing protein n=1 Tax=Amborella trichopoda TaxID=13333 RepID=W1NPG2_AMBTC|nr:hypothetical protein AMTR_s00128p00104140 [Amborella trichopoda]